MTFRVEISALAHDDLVDIREWIATDAGVEIAERYIDRVRARLARLSDFPNRGTPRPEAGVGVRSISFERRRVVFYRVDADSVTILRVLDGARDLGPMFDEGARATIANLDHSMLDTSEE